MPDPRINLSESTVRIEHLEVPRREVAAYLAAAPEGDRAGLLVRAIEVGVFCLERAQSAKDLDFVRRQIEALLTTVEREVTQIPQKTEASLVAKIGVNDGQLLSPIKKAVDDAALAAGQRIKEVKDLLTNDLDPGKETTTLGRALQRMRDLLDPKRTDSIQGCLDAAVAKTVAEDGSLAKAVKVVVADAIKPLTERVEALTLEVRGQDAATEALQQTTQKGVTYEEEVAALLQDWGGRLGLQVRHVGGDNRPGDVLVSADPGPSCGVELTIVIEARDRQSALGRLQITEVMSTAMAERTAGAGVYLSRMSDGLAKEVSDWAEGACDRGSFVACTHEHLLTAIRFLLAAKRLETMRASTPKVNTASVETQIQRVRTALRRIGTINTKAGEVRGTADAIKQEAESLRDEVRGALTEIEDVLRTVPPLPEAPADITAEPDGQSARSS